MSQKTNFPSFRRIRQVFFYICYVFFELLACQGAAPRFEEHIHPSFEDPFDDIIPKSSRKRNPFQEKGKPDKETPLQTALKVLRSNGWVTPCNSTVQNGWDSVILPVFTGNIQYRYLPPRQQQGRPHFGGAPVVGGDEATLRTHRIPGAANPTYSAFLLLLDSRSQRKPCFFFCAAL